MGPYFCTEKKNTLVKISMYFWTLISQWEIRFQEIETCNFVEFAEIFIVTRLEFSNSHQVVQNKYGTIFFAPKKNTLVKISMYFWTLISQWEIQFQQIGTCNFVEFAEIFIVTRLEFSNSHQVVQNKYGTIFFAPKKNCNVFCVCEVR
jgi:hypothetical protein